MNYTYANVQESVARLEEFMVNTSKQLFDPDMVLMPLNNAVERITIPAINLDLAHNTIREQFNSGTVEGDEIAELDKNFNVLCGDLNKIAKEACNEIDQILSKSPEIE
ncbi:MAG: hypothetical protein JJV99_02340 [Colwellia sp.]|nr:hypothetical protein [Colwellia sp.]